MKSELKRAFRFNNMFPAFLSIILFYFFNYPYIDWINALRFGNGTVLGYTESFYLGNISTRALLPVSAAIPYAVSLADDIQTGYITQILNKKPYSRFVFERFCAAAIAGGTVLAAARLVLILWFALKMPFSAETNEYVFASPLFNHTIAEKSLFAYTFFHVLTQFLCGCWCATMALTVGVFIFRKGVILSIVPLMLLIIEQLTSKSLLDAATGYPSYYWTFLKYYGGLLFSILVSLVLAAISYAVLYSSLKKKVYK